MCYTYSAFQFRISTCKVWYSAYIGGREYIRQQKAKGVTAHFFVNLFE